MSKVLVIPDIHLKPFIFDIADNIIKSTTIDHIVFVGDLLDEFYQSNNIDLYKETIDRAIQFKHEHPNTLYCWGNHDIAYFATNWDCCGNSYLHKYEIVHMLNLYEQEVEPKYVHNIDNYLFSHAGIGNKFIQSMSIDTNCSINDLIDKINSIDIDSMGSINTPLWLRPKKTNNKIYYDTYIQVIGHTPVKNISTIEDNVLIVDTFSLIPTTLKPYGDSTMLIIDTNNNEAFIYNNTKLLHKVSKSNWNSYIYK